MAAEMACWSSFWVHSEDLEASVGVERVARVSVTVAMALLKSDIWSVENEARPAS